MNHERIPVAARRMLVGALMIGLAGCGSSDSDEEPEPSEEVSASAEEVSVEQDEDSDSVPSGGGGTGSIVVDGIAYEFIADFCFSETDFLQISGPGVTADGVPFYGSISINSNEDYDDDGVTDVAADVTVEIGAESAFDRTPDDMASYSATVLDSAAFAFADFEYEIDDDGQVAGSGEITDTNYVETTSGAYVPFTFSGGCG